jgi:hypothetical protein
MTVYTKEEIDSLQSAIRTISSFPDMGNSDPYIFATHGKLKIHVDVNGEEETDLITMGDLVDRMFFAHGGLDVTLMEKVITDLSAAVSEFDAFDALDLNHYDNVTASMEMRKRLTDRANAWECGHSKADMGIE